MSCLRPGATVSHYRITELIASGGMGEVYKAVDLHLGRPVALKILPPAAVSDPAARRRFVREARLASHLSHPSICTVFEAGQAGDFVFIAMQYVTGATLRDRMAGGALPIEKALGYALDIAGALEEAHRHGIIHRDIKPSNIMINERDVAVMLDFGLAKQFPREEPDEEGPTLSMVTTGKHVIGTLAYMSPEQTRADNLDARSDIFSFGILLYEMLAGRRPFRALSNADLVRAILYENPRPLSALRAEIPFELESIVGKALRKDPAGRYQSVAELRDELLRFMREKGYATGGYSTDARRGAARGGTRWQGLFSPSRAAVWGAALLAFGLLAWLAWRAPSSREADPAALRFTQLDSWKSEPGDAVIYGKFSRDGRMLAFSATRGGAGGIWIKQVTSGEPIPVTRDQWDNWSPLWSPDNQQIAFLSNRGGQTGVWTIPALGGTPALVKALEPGWPALKHWSRDGRTIYYEFNSNFYALDLAARTVRQLTNFDPAHLPYKSFSLAPDEQRVAYNDERDGQSDIWVMALGGVARRVTDDAAQDWFPVWHPDGRRIIYSSNRDGVQQICVAYLDGRPPAQITVGDGDHAVQDVSPDGDKLLDITARDESAIWGVRVDTGEEEQVTSDIGVKLWPEISPTGRMIAYQATGARATLFRSAIIARPLAGEGTPTQLAGDAFNLSWSPDGSRLAFLRLAENGARLYTINATSGEPERLTAERLYIGGYSLLPCNRDQQRDYDWSPDGGRLAYCALGEGMVNLWTVAADGSAPVRLTANEDANLAFYCPLWSPDGRRLAFTAETRVAPADGRRVWSVRLAGADRSGTIWQADSCMRLLGWSPDGGSVIVALAEGKTEYPTEPAGVTILEIAVDGGRRREVARLPAAYFSNLQLSRDGQTLAFVARTGGADNIHLKPARGAPRRVTRNADARLYFSSLVWAPDGRTIYFTRQASWRLISLIDQFR